MSIFARTTPAAPAGDPVGDQAGLLKVYKEGREDERTRAAREAELHGAEVHKAEVHAAEVHRAEVHRAEVQASDAHAGDPALREAYDRGRRDQKARRSRSPMIALVVLAIAAIGGTVLFLAAREGSFAAGGGVVDRQVSQAADATSRITDNAASRTGDALTDAGRRLKSKSPDAAR